MQWARSIRVCARFCCQVRVAVVQAARIQAEEGKVREDGGDEVMTTVRALTPADGSLSEQVERTTGQPTSAPHLTWSYAAFVAAAVLRARCKGRWDMPPI